MMGARTYVHFGRDPNLSYICYMISLQVRCAPGVNSFFANIQQVLDNNYEIGEYMLLNVKELQLLQPPAAPQLFLAARPLRDAGLPVSGVKAVLIERLLGGPPPSPTTPAPSAPPLAAVAGAAAVLIEIEHCKS